MNSRIRVSSNSPYEPLIGFSRAVRVGDTVYVSGTVAWGPDGTLVGPGDVYAQAKQAIANIEAALKEAGAALRDVVRTRVYLTDIPAGKRRPALTARPLTRCGRPAACWRSAVWRLPTCWWR